MSPLKLSFHFTSHFSNCLSDVIWFICPKYILCFLTSVFVCAIFVLILAYHSSRSSLNFTPSLKLFLNNPFFLLWYLISISGLWDIGYCPRCYLLREVMQVVTSFLGLWFDLHCSVCVCIRVYAHMCLPYRI